MTESKELSFSITEYRTRLQRLQQALAAADCDGMVVTTPENMTYLTGYRTPGYYAYQALVVPTEGEPSLVTRHFETENARRYAWIDDITGVKDDEDPIAATVAALEALRLTDGKVGIEFDCWFLTNRQFRALSERTAATSFVDMGGTVEQLRLVKSPAEINYIRAACRQAEAGVHAGIDAVHAGVSEDDVAAAAVAAIIAAGCEYWSLPPFICAGPRSAIPHATWGGRRIASGDVVYFELPGVVNRYSGSLMRTVVVGKASPSQRRVADASIAGLEAAIETIAPGVPASAVDAACRRKIEEAGLGEGFKHRTGYSIGLNFPPDWGEGHICHLKVGDDRPLEAGMTFHLVPLVFFGDEFGIGFSETVLVTEHGCEVMTDYPRELLEV